MACKIIASTYFVLLAPSRYRPRLVAFVCRQLVQCRKKTRINETNLSLVFALLILWIVSHSEKNEID